MDLEAAGPPRLPGELWTLVLATAASYPVGLFAGLSWLLPLLNVAPAYAVMIARLVRGDRRGGLFVVLMWALTLAVCGTVTFALWPAQARVVVFHGYEYQNEMFEWIRSGEGREGSPSLFLPQYALLLTALLVLGLASAGALSLLMGAALVNSMNFYVASLATSGVPTWAVVFLGWPPWALCRVAAFSVLGVVLAEPLLFRVLGRPGPGRAAVYLRWAAIGIGVDCLLRALLAPTWGLWLRAYLY